MVSTKNKLATILLISGILMFYVMQMNPAPVLPTIAEELALTSDVTINMVANIIFVTIVIGCIVGTPIEKRIGTIDLYSLASLFVILGCLIIALFGDIYEFLLVGRAVFGFGFGLGVPFIGSAIMDWYSPKEREIMNTVNGVFPFVGTLICYLLTEPLMNAFGGNWRFALAVWGLIVLIVLIVWVPSIKEDNIQVYDDERGGEELEKGVYRELIGRREIKLCSVTFICDFCCYSYIGVILPTLLMSADPVSDAAVNLLAAFAFPGVGLIGSTLGGVLVARTGLRRPALLIGQIGKFIGILIATLGADMSLGLIVFGIAIFGFSNGFWMPALYCVPMDLKGMTPLKAGAAFALMTAVALSFGFIAPVVGGALTDMLVAASGLADPVASHLFGLRWSLFIFGFVNIIGFICMVVMKETGTRRKEGD